MKKIFLRQMLKLYFVFTMAATAHALDVETHKVINENIAQNSLYGFSLGNYLTNQLGFENGINEKFNNLEAWKRLRDGGVYEDKPPEWYSIPYLRSLNHFHNPLTDQGYGIGNSAVQWSQMAEGTQSPGGYYSWQDVRDYFYNALTSPDKTERDTNFANTFRGLGQLMHLVQDMSVPEHSRNDGHVFYCYEDWVKDAPFSNYSSRKSILPNALANPVFFNKDALPSVSKFPGALVPIANLFDTNQYTAANPDPNVTVQDNIGLAEFSNANFLSPDTMIYSGFPSDFPNPDWPNVVEINPTNEATGEKTTYLKKLGKDDPPEGGKTGSGVHVEHLAAVRLPYKYLPQDKKYGKYLSLNDDKVYADYAKLLLPRAVGYSSQLLSYFFRGQIDMIPDDVSGSGYVIVNDTDEDMSGTFELYYDTSTDVRALVNGGSWTLRIDKFGSVSNRSTNVTFTPPNDAKEPGKYILVFKGKLGNEDNAIATNIVGTSKTVYGGINPTSTYFTAQLSSDGNNIWLQPVGSSDTPGYLMSIAVFEDMVYFSSYTLTPDGYRHYKLTALRLANGKLVWDQDLGSATGSTIGFKVNRIRVDTSGIYLAGLDAGNYSGGSGPGWHLQKRSMTGSLVWDVAVPESYGVLWDLALTANYAYAAKSGATAEVLKFDKQDGQYSMFSAGNYGLLASSNPATTNAYVYAALSSDPYVLQQIGGWSVTYQGRSAAYSNPYPYLPGGINPSSGPGTFIIPNVGGEIIEAIAADDSGVYAVIQKPFDTFYYLYNPGGTWLWYYGGDIYHGYRVVKYSHSGGVLWNIEFAGNTDGVNVGQGPFIKQMVVNKDGLYLAGYQTAHTPLPKVGMIQKINTQTGEIVFTKYGAANSDYSAIDATQ